MLLLKRYEESNNLRKYKDEATAEDWMQSHYSNLLLCVDIFRVQPQF